MSVQSHASPVAAQKFQAVLAALQAIVSTMRVSAAQVDRALHARDQSSHPDCLPDWVVWPRTTAEVSAILRYANEARLPVTAWGAGTDKEI